MCNPIKRAYVTKQLAIKQLKHRHRTEQSKTTFSSQSRYCERFGVRILSTIVLSITSYLSTLRVNGSAANGNSKQIGVKNEEPEKINTQVLFLRNNIGRGVPKVKKQRHPSSPDTLSIQGRWTPNMEYPHFEIKL